MFVTGDERTLRVAWQQHIGSAALPMSWFDVVVAGHREPHRHYHGLRHVCWVVRHVRDLTRRIEVRDVDAIVAAACFHDVIYDPR